MMPKEKRLYRNLGTWSWTGIFQDAVDFWTKHKFLWSWLCLYSSWRSSLDLWLLKSLRKSCSYGDFYTCSYQEGASSTPRPFVPVHERMCRALMTTASHFKFLICNLWLFTTHSVVIFSNASCGKVYNCNFAGRIHTNRICKHYKSRQKGNLKILFVSLLYEFQVQK